MERIPLKHYKVQMKLESFDILEVGGRYFRSYDEDMYLSGIEEIEKDEFTEYKKHTITDDKPKELTKEEKEEVRKYAEEGLDFIHKHLGY